MNTGRNCLICTSKLDVEEILPEHEEIYRSLTRVFINCLSSKDRPKTECYGNVFPFCKICRKAVATLHRNYSRYQICLKKIQRTLESVAAQRILVINRSTDCSTSVAKAEYTPEQLHCKDSVDVTKELVGSEVREGNDEEERYFHNGRIQESIELNSNVKSSKYSEPIIDRQSEIYEDTQNSPTHLTSGLPRPNEFSSASSDDEVTDPGPVTSEDRSAAETDCVRGKPSDRKQNGTESANQNDSVVFRKGIQKHPLIRTGYRTFVYLEKFTIQIVDDGFQCCTCDYTHRGRNVIMNHIRKVHTRPGHPNITMVEKSPNKWYYKEFFAEKLGDEFHCGACDFACKRRASMRYHLRCQHYVRAHPECAPNKTFICEVCGAQLSSAFALKLHKQGHEREFKFICKNCDKRFNTSGSLRGHHLRMHAEEGRKFMCECCGRKFCTQNRLKSHMFQHTGIREFMCKTCGKSYASEVALHVHLNSHKGKKYTCDICDMEFTQSYSVTRHKRTAHGTDTSSKRKE